MKIAVIGTGVVGITTAYELSAQGHEVHVFDRNSAAAEAASFANAGLLSAAYAGAWHRPGINQRTLRQLWQKHAAARLHRLRGQDLRWLWRWRKASLQSAFAGHHRQLVELAAYSREHLTNLSDKLHLSYDSTPGYLALLRSEQEQRLIEPVLAVMKEQGVKFATLDADQARAIEPALRPETALHQAIHFPEDRVANCRQFALLLKHKAEALGAQFHFNADVQALSSSQPRLIRLNDKDDGILFDAVTICSGDAAKQMLRPLGLNLPMTSVYSYAISAAVREPLDAPRSGVMDERYMVAITRLGQRVRISGGTEFGGNLRVMHNNSLQTLYKVLDDWFPGAARTHDHPQVWKGARAALPDGLPVIGPSGVPGVWLNLCHASGGWTLACGSARALADRIGQKSPDIDLNGLGLERLLK